MWGSEEQDGLSTREKNLARSQQPAIKAEQQPQHQKQGAPWAKLKLTKAKKPERAYIQGTLTKGEKLRLIVEITRRVSENYFAHIETIYNKLEAESLTKAGALEEREKLCSQD